MLYRNTFTLDETAAKFLATKNNKSAFINELILKARAKEFEATILKANIEEAEDEEYQKEFALWDETLADGGV